MSSEDLSGPFTYETVNVLNKGTTLLAMITSNTRPDGSRGTQMKVLRQIWERISVLLSPDNQTSSKPIFGKGEGAKLTVNPLKFNAMPDKNKSISTQSVTISVPMDPRKESRKN